MNSLNEKLGENTLYIDENNKIKACWGKKED
jgi:hypothetical protein